MPWARIVRVSPLLGASELRRALRASLDALRARRAAIDAANVYPVPDGDTGTNLVLTFEAIDRALDAVSSDDLAEVARVVKTASLMGARGNSGVIMAQILRGVCGSLDAGPGDPARVASGFKRAVELAYEAVLDPAEGTILTVARAASDAASGAHTDVPAQFDALARAAAAALARTPEQLPVLAQAGVVDAGGMGLVAVLDAFAATLAGREIEASGGDSVPDVHPSQRCEQPDDGFAYEVMYALHAPDGTIPALRQLLGTVGDSVAVVGGEGTWRVHVHTDDPEKAVRFGEAVGTLTGVEVVSFAEQIAEATSPRGPAVSSDAAQPAQPTTAERVPGQRGIPMADRSVESSLVVVASGAGMQAMFRELGATIVDGGTTMNPSVADLLSVIEASNAERVLVLPNNENVFAAAGAAKGESSKDVVLLRSNDMAEGLAAALEFDVARSADENALRMNHALGRVRTGVVAIANRTATTPEGEIVAGDALGFAEGAMVTPHGDPNDPVVVLTAVAHALSGPADEIVTVLCGADVRPEERVRAEAALRELLPGLEMEIHDGGQPVHRYLISIE